jgi:hypothetical protein
VDVEIDVAEALGAEELASQDMLSLYVPNKDRNGKVFDPTPWIKEATELLYRIGEGATVTPPHDGVSEGAAGAPLWEKTVIVYTYVIPGAFRRELPNLREFLHRFGRTTNQQSVGLSLAGAGQSHFFRIKTFDA